MSTMACRHNASPLKHSGLGMRPRGRRNKYAKIIEMCLWELRHWMHKVSVPFRVS